MRAFVAGATGYVGGEVVRILAERGVETIAHVRPDSPSLQKHRDLFAHLGAVTDTTPWELDAMVERVGAFEPHLVFACLGTTRARRRGADDRANETYLAVDYGLSSMLLKASQTLTPPPRYVFLSSLGVRASTGSSYIEARYKLEQELVASGVPYTIVRPAIISGDDRAESRPLERAGAVFGDALLQLAGAVGFGKVREKYASMTGSDLAAAMVNFALSIDGQNREVAPDELRASLGPRNG